MKITKVIPSVMLLAFSTSASAALYERLGGMAYYDDVSNVTWLSDANMAGSAMTWEDSMAWASGLDVAGVTGWRLPNFVLGSPDSELRYMFYDILGGTSGVPITISHNANFDLFSNVMDVRYWYSHPESGCEGDATPCATVFNFNGGFTDSFGTHVPFYAWAVHDGDVVPVPAAVWLFVSGLAGLVAFSRQKKV